MRAVSTVLDVAVFLLLVSVALVTLAVPTAEPPRATADETAEAIAATTGNATYAPTDRSGGRLTPRRTAAGTHAELLTRAALANLHLGNASLTSTTDGFRSAVREELHAALAWSTERTSVVATWEPYPEAPLRGEFTVGSRPPPGADVATATLRIPVPVRADTDAAATADGGYRRVAREIVEAVLQTTLAKDRRGVHAASGHVRRDRQRRLGAYATALDVDVSGAGPDEAVVEAVTRELTERLTADLRSRYDSPAAAADAVRTGHVRVVVREWSA